MKIAAITIPYVAALLSVAANAESPKNSISMTEIATEREVLEVIKNFNRAFANNDPDKYFSYIASDITVITPSNPYRVEGIEQDRAEFEHSLRSGVSRVGYFQEMQPKVQLFGEAAIVTYFSRGSYGPEGQEKVYYYKETDVLHKQSGAWKIVHIHVSSTR
jgi:ketosteroid isomerase-like protein